MSMTREEAIQILRDTPITIRGAIEGKEHIDTLTLYATAQNMAIDALRAVSREQVEKVWMSEWRWVGADRWNECYECRNCGKMNMDDPLFCPNCGATMTDEAVQRVVKRLEVIRNGNL